MRSPKLILILVLFGAALLVAALVPSNTDGTGLSGPGAWVTGLLGAAALLVGLIMLRTSYKAARAAQGGGPMPLFLKLVLTLCGSTALALVAYVVLQSRPPPGGTARSNVAGVKTKADYIAEQQAETRRRQLQDKPAPAPEAPTFK